MTDRWQPVPTPSPAPNAETVRDSATARSHWATLHERMWMENQWRMNSSESEMKRAVPVVVVTSNLAAEMPDVVSATRRCELIPAKCYFEIVANTIRIVSRRTAIVQACPNVDRAMNESESESVSSIEPANVEMNVEMNAMRRVGAGWNLVWE